MKVYLARPISGCSADDIKGYFDDVKADLELWGFDVLSPMTGKGALRNEIKYKAEGINLPVATNHAIYERDMWMVRECDIILMLLPDTDIVSIGCCMELCAGSVQGKHTVLILEGEKNIHKHAFVLEAADIVFTTLDDAMAYMRNMAFQVW